VASFDIVKQIVTHVFFSVSHSSAFHAAVQVAGVSNLENCGEVKTKKAPVLGVFLCGRFSFSLRSSNWSNNHSNECPICSNQGKGSNDIDPVRLFQ